jgi:hypothetical protein
MTVKYLIDESGNKTAVQMSLEDYYTLLENANILPQHVVNGILKGLDDGKLGLTKSTEQVMKKYGS